MNQQPEKRQISSPRLTRNSKEDLNYTFQQEQSKWRKKAWTDEEDKFLTKLVAKHGPQKWTLIAQNLPGRIGKQCRERWHNHLNPDINKNEWTQNQQWILFLLHKNMGNQWAQFTKYLRGRTDNSIKNHWNSIMKKRASHYMERYKGIKANLQSSKEAGETDIDTYLLQKLGNQFAFQQFQRWQKAGQKVKSKEDLPIKSMSIVKKQSFENYFDTQKTAKKKAKNQTLQKRQETAVKQKKINQFNFNLNFNSRLSQLSVFGVQSKPNIVSAFSLLEEGQPLVLEPQPSFNDFSLSIQCFEEEKQDNQQFHQKKKRRSDNQVNRFKMSSKQSLDLLKDDKIQEIQ